MSYITISTTYKKHKVYIHSDYVVLVITVCIKLVHKLLMPTIQFSLLLNLLNILELYYKHVIFVTSVT